MLTFMNRLATGLQAMLVRDACIDRFILGSIQFFHTKNVIHVGEQYPVMFPLQWSEPLPRTDPHFVDAGPLVVNHGRASESQVLAADAAEAEVVETTKSGKDKIPRPPNAFILYRKDQHPLIVDGMGDDKIHNNQVCKSCFLKHPILLLTSPSCNHRQDVADRDT